MSADIFNSGMRLRPHRRSVIVTDQLSKRHINTAVLPEQHAAFDALAARHNMTRTALLRQLIEGAIRHPDLMTKMLSRGVDA